MTAPGTRPFLHHLRTALRAPGGDLTDGELLGRFVARGDPDAFEALVRRHGPMVLGVCRRVLRHAQDAEDAFQAAFVVLARKAATVTPREAVGNWLFGVARQTALEARAVRARRRARERSAEPGSLAYAPDDGGGRELWSLLDAAIKRLPLKYRLPVVLCELEGRTRGEVARQLGLPEGTLSSRLATARKLLARRLASQAPSLAAIFPPATAAGVSASLVASTVRAAAGEVSTAVSNLQQGVMKAMLLAKLKAVVGVTLLAVTVSAGVVGASHRRAFAADSTPTNAAPQRDELDALRMEIEALRKGLQATRQRVRSLEAEVETLKHPPEPVPAGGTEGGSGLPRQYKPSPQPPKAGVKPAADPAAKAYDTARYYQSLGRHYSAYFYYQLVCRKFPETVFAEWAARDSKPLENLIDQHDVPKVTSSHIGQIIITGNEMTEDRDILDALNISPGEAIHEDELSAAEDRLRRKGISATVRVLPRVEGSVYQDIQIKVKEKADRDSGPVPQPVTDPNGRKARDGFPR